MFDSTFGNSSLVFSVVISLLLLIALVVFMAGVFGRRMKNNNDTFSLKAKERIPYTSVEISYYQ